MSTWLDRISAATICALTFFTPLAFGSVHPWAFSLLEIAVFFLVIVWMAKVIIVRGERLGARLTPHPSPLTPLVLPLTLFFVLVLFQMMPLPSSFLQALSPATHELYRKSLPGWPEKTPYEDLVGGKAQSGQTAEVRGQRSAVILPTPDEVRRGAPVPFSQPEHYHPSPAAPSASRLTPELWLPLSVAPSLTGTALLKFIAYSLLFFFILLYPFRVSDRWSSHNSDINPTEVNFIRAVLIAVLLSGLIVAMIGIAQAFTWNGKILWFFVPYDWGQPMAGGVPRASGPFVNPDQFGNYLALTFFLSLAGAISPTFIARGEARLGCRFICGTTALVILSAILLSLSRGAWLGTLVGLAVFLTLFFRLGKKKNLFPLAGSSKWVVRLCVMGFCVALVLSFLLIGDEGRKMVGARLGNAGAAGGDLIGRASLWLASLKMFSDFPLWGTGLGSWPDIFPRYRSAPWVSVFYREAHNDYVQLLAETGIIGFGLLAWFFVYGGKQLLQGLKKVSQRVVPLLAAIFATLAAMAFHELLDFNLQVPANAFLFTLIFALALRMTGSLEQGAGSAERLTPEPVLSESRRASPLARFLTPVLSFVEGPNVSRLTALLRLTPHASRLTPLLISAIAVVLVVVALRQERIPYPYNLKEPDSVAQARELLLSHPARASSHLSLLRLLEHKAPLTWQLSESQAALWLEPSNPYIRDLYASTLLRMGKTAEGLREITRSIVDSPSLSTHFYLSGKLLPWLSRAEQKAVVEGFKQALALGYPESLGSLAGFYRTLGRFSDLGMFHEQAALRESDEPKRADLLINAGLAYARARDEAKAEILFRKAAAALPHDPRAYRQLVAVIYGPGKDLNGIKQVVSEGIKNGVPPFDLYLLLAEAMHQAGSPGESKAALSSAKAEIDKSIQKGEDPHPLYLLLADGARRAGGREEETAALLAALELRPRSSDTLSRLGGLYLEQANFDRAALYFSRIANINPNSADVYYRLALAEEGRYRFADAGKAYARAIELAPDNKGFRERYEGLRKKVEENRKETDNKSP